MFEFIIHRLTKTITQVTKQNIQFNSIRLMFSSSVNKILNRPGGKVSETAEQI